MICPYCGETQPVGRCCRVCGGVFEPLSRQATHDAMGPWCVRDSDRPFHPGCSYETLVKLIERGRVTKYSIIRGPTTRQFWTVARHVPGVAHLLGYCHACDGSVDPSDHGCPHCGVPFGAYLDRNYLGLPDIHPEVWEEARGNEKSGLIGPEGRGDPPSPRGLSSFAADEELLGAPAIRAAGDGEAAPRAAGFARRASDSARGALSEQAAVEGWHASPAVRSMQRRMARQERTIRLLTVLVVIVILAGVVFNLTTVASLRRQRESSAPMEPARQSNTAPSVFSQPSDVNTPVPDPAEDAPPQAPEDGTPLEQADTEREGAG